MFSFLRNSQHTKGSLARVTFPRLKFSTHSHKKQSIKSLTPPKTVVFDWDETLTDSTRYYWRAINQVRGALGHTQWEDSSFIHHLSTHGFTTRMNMFKIMFDDKHTDEAVKLFEKFFRATAIPANVQFPHLIDTLTLLRHHFNLPLAVLTNTERWAVEKQQFDLGIGNYFSVVLGYEKGLENCLKPQPDLLLRALTSLNILAGPDVWLLGDSKSDVGCAKAAGCSAILFNKDGQRYNPKQIEELSPDAMVTSLKHFGELVHAAFATTPKATLTSPSRSFKV